MKTSSLICCVLVLTAVVFFAQMPRANANSLYRGHLFREPFFDHFNNWFPLDRFFGFDECGSGMDRSAQEQSAESSSLQQGSTEDRSATNVAEQRSLSDIWRPYMTKKFPAVDVMRRENEYIITCDVPGVTKENLQVEITPQGNRKVLQISGERKEEHEEEDKEKGYWRMERGYGKFSRSLLLPEDIDENAIKAKQEHGVLTLTLPRIKQAQSPSLRINVE